MPDSALGDARRPAPLRRRRPAAARRPLRTTRSTEFVRRAAGGDAGAGLPELAAGDRRPHRRQRVPRLRAVARAGRDAASSRSSTARSGSPGRWPSSAPPRACARSSASGSRAWRPATTDLLELAATAGAEFELDIVRARRRPRASPSCSPPLDEAVRSGMIEELPVARGSPTGSRTSSCAGRSTTGSPGCGARSCTCASARRSSAPRGARAARSPTSRTTSPPPRRSAAPSAASTTTSRAARAATAALAFDEAAARLRTALELGIEEPARARGGAARARHRQPPRRQGARRAGGVRGRRRRSPASWATRSCSRGPRSATRTPAGARDRRPGRGRAARGGGRRARRRAARSCASGCSAGSPARSTSAASTSAARSCARARSAMARRARRPRRRSPRCWCARYWARGTSSLEEILDDAHRGARPRRGAGRHRDPRRGDGLARARVRRAGRPRRPRGARSRRCCATAEQTAQPFMLHVAEHYGSAIALCDGRLDEAEATARSARTSGAGC